MTSPAAAVHIVHASETSSESRGSGGTAAGVRISYTPKRRQWSTVVVAVPANLEEELGRYGPLCKSDTKAGKTYYKCKLHSRFSCGMMVRTVPEIETGSTCIQLCGLKHCVTSRPAMAMCAIGYAGPPTPSKLRMYRALAARAGVPRSRP
jgi:hypothetical protein